MKNKRDNLKPIKKKNNTKKNLKIKTNNLKKNKKKTKTKNTKFIIIGISLIIVVLLLGLTTYSLQKNKPVITRNEKKEIKIDYRNYFYNIVNTKNEKKLYELKEDNFEEIGKVSMGITLELIEDEYIDKGYFKIKDLDYYIDYKDLEEGLKEEKNNFFKNYIPFNLSIKTNEVTNLYQDNSLVYSINIPMELPILIKEENFYGVMYKDKLFYVKKDEATTIEQKNTDLKYTNGIAALVYHATYDSKNKEEKQKCLNNNATICLSDIQFDTQMKYLKDFNFYTATMKDIEYFIDGKVQLPERTVLITIDDGYYFDASAKILEKYDLHATLFLIGGLAEVPEWKTDSWYSKNVELHSHTYLMHTPNVCSGGQGSILKCGNKEELLADLKKSREQLNGSTVFCYPFFEYNDYAINVLKEAGFTMAFAGGRQKIKVGSNKMKLPRYGVINTSTMEDFKRIIY